MQQHEKALDDASSAEQTKNHQPEESLIQALQYGLRQFNVRLTRYELTESAGRFPAEEPQQEQWAAGILESRGIQAAWQQCTLDALKPWTLPAIANMGDDYLLVYRVDDDRVDVITPALGDRVVSITRQQFMQTFTGKVLFFRPRSAIDRRADDLVLTYRGHWFWSSLLGFKRYLFEAIGLSVVINVLALGMSIFTMTVYNRVLPNQTYITLWTMAIGVTLALVFEMAARIGRAWILDRAGKKIDLLLGARIFRHVMAGRMENRAQSSGAFGNVMQSFESVRDLTTSVILTAVADVPFVFLFLIVIYMVAGPLVWSVISILVAITLVVVVMQIPLKRNAAESMKIGSNRQGLVMESLDNLETIKSLRAENHMAARHDTASAALAKVTMQSRFLSVTGTTLIQGLQQFGVVILMLWGAYLVGDGEISMGGIIATMTLMSRAVMPIATLAAYGLRIQQAITSLDTLNKVMSAPTEHHPDKVYVQLMPGGQQDLLCTNVRFQYQEDLPPVVEGLNMKIAKGERVAILGKMGSGKSSLLRLLVGLYTPSGGEVRFSGVDLREIAPAELRSRIALVSQDTRLMFGSLRDNLLLGAPWASDEDMMEIAALTGVAEIAARHPKGYGMVIGERGETLSGGQKQAIALARAVLARPDVLLLDEPTSGMDMASETRVMESLLSVTGGRTVIVVTHRPAVLRYVDRVIVMDDGVKVADGPRERIVELLNGGKIPSAQALKASGSTQGIEI